MKALVEPGGRVAQVVADGGEFEVAEPLRWLDAAPDVTPEHTFDADARTFVAPERKAPPAPELTALERLADIEAAIEDPANGTLEALRADIAARHQARLAAKQG